MKIPQTKYETVPSGEYLASCGDIPPGYDLDTDDLLDRRVRLSVVVRQGGNGEYSRVESVLSIGDGDVRPPPEPVGEGDRPLPF